MAFSRNNGFVSAIPTDPAATAAGYLTPTRYNLPMTVTDATSGGIPYFSSTTTEACSALLASGGVVIGGGAGAAPATVAGLTYVNGLFTAGAITVGSASVPSGTQGQFYQGENATQIEFGSSTPVLRMLQGEVDLVQNMVFAWGNQTNTFTASSTQLTLSKQANGVLQVGTTGVNSLGSIRCKFQSSDGTAGVAAFGPSIVTSITVKDGIITAIS